MGSGPTALEKAFHLPRYPSPPTGPPLHARRGHRRGQRSAGWCRWGDAGGGDAARQLPRCHRADGAQGRLRRLSGWCVLWRLCGWCGCIWVLGDRAHTGALGEPFGSSRILKAVHTLGTCILTLCRVCVRSFPAVQLTASAEHMFDYRQHHEMLVNEQFDVRSASFSHAPLSLLHRQCSLAPLCMAP